MFVSNYKIIEKGMLTSIGILDGLPQFTRVGVVQDNGLIILWDECIKYLFIDHDFGE